LEAFTMVQTDSLRKDVDSLYANCTALEARIAALEGKVIDLAARVSSIVAVPSMNAEFRHFDISGIDTTFFAATFAVTPKAAVANIAAENLKINFKEGLTRGSEALDTTFNVVKVVADEAKGEITAFVAFDKRESLPSDEVKIDARPHITWDWIFPNFKWELYGTLPPSTVYFSLAFAGEDKAGKYEENSEYVKAHDELDEITLANARIVKDGAELAAEDAALEDTLAFDGSEGTKFASLFGDLDVAFKFNDELISKEDIAELLDTTFKVVPDTASISARYGGSTHTPYAVNDSTAGIVVTSDKGTNLCAEKEDVGNWVRISIDGVKINGAGVPSGFSITEKHWVGAKTVEYTLPAVTEDWTYMTAKSVSRTVSITNGETAEAIHDLIKNNPGTITCDDTHFTISADNGKGVDVKVNSLPRNPEAKDTVYNVVFTKAANIAVGDSVNFAINWKYTLAARPADETIALADVDTVATDYTKGIAVAIDEDIVAKTFAAFDAAYDKTIDTTVVSEEIAAAVKAIASATVYNGEDTLDWTVSNGCVAVPALTKAGAYNVELEAEVFGITYTYTYTINLAWKEALKLHPTPYVSAGVAVVDADTTDTPYTLKEMDLAKYLQVFNADTLAKGLTADYSVLFETELEDTAKFINEHKKDTVIGVISPIGGSINVNDGILENTKLNWNTYVGREVKVTAYLVNSKDTVDTYAFTLKYNKPITSFAAGTQEVKRVAGVNAEAVLTKSFDVKGIYHGDKNLIVDTTGAWIDRTNYYGCEILFNVKKAVFKVDGVETLFTKDVDYELSGLTEVEPGTGLYKATGGVLRNAKVIFLGDNNNKNIELSVPVILGYKYDYNWNEAYKDNVVIKVVNE
ncbi:MAG: hypothetical protein MJY46_02605, partial [Bacteroidales bacterium]|nr:hypothetical protein [Bacteroidales bacterium]